METLNSWLSTPTSSFGSIEYVLIAIFALIWGSFLSVVAYRLPLMRQRKHILDTNETYGTDIEVPTDVNLAYPGSFCPNCQAKIPLYLNIPIVSYLLLRGKCSTCNDKISLRYPILELLTLVVILVTVYCSTDLWMAMFKFVPISVLIVLFWTDFESRLLPDNLTIPLGIIGLMVMGLYTDYYPSVSFLDACLGLVLGYFALASINFIYRLLRKSDGIGQGDFKLFAALGAWFGWFMLPVILLCASLVTLIYAAFTYKRSGLAYQREVPLGSFLAIVGIWFTALGVELEHLAFL